MRCRRLHATITTAVCLQKQAYVDRYVKTRKKSSNAPMLDVPNNPAQPCFKCPQGERVKKGLEDDMDVQEIIEQTTQKNREVLNVKVRESKKRMKEANRPEYVDPPFGIAPKEVSRTLSVEIGGQRIELCPECARRYLRV